MKQRVKRIMLEQGVHPRLWSYCLVYETDIYNRIWKSKNNQTGWEAVTGNTPDISEYLDFDFYGWVWYWDLGDKKAKLGRWLGVNRHVGQALSLHILKGDGRIITSTTVQNVTQKDALLPAVQDMMRSFDSHANNYLTTKSSTLAIDAEIDAAMILDADKPDNDDDFVFQCDENLDIDSYDLDTYNKFVGSAIQLNRGGKLVRGRVKDRVRDDAGNLVGKQHQKPLVDTSRYSAEYDGGSEDELAANVIAEAIFAQVDDEGREFLLLEDIIDYRRDDSIALDKINGFETKPNGNNVPKKTTMGWELMVRWKDGTESWIALKDLKYSNPLEVMSYDQANNLVDELAFVWWVPHFLLKRERIISKLGTSKYWRTQEKLGITVPRSIEQTYKLDEENGNTLWQDAIAKEMRHVLPAFKDAECTLEEVKKKLVGYQKI